MQEFHHPHVMSLIGVCLDAGAGVSIVMPYMGNGSLLDYLKKERESLELDDDSEIDQVGIKRLGSETTNSYQNVYKSGPYRYI